MSKLKLSSKSNDACLCSGSQGLFLSSRHVSIVISIILFLFCATFITGYFLGKKQCIQNYVQQTADDAFADTIYTSIVTHGTDGSEDAGKMQETQSVPIVPIFEEKQTVCQQPVEFFEKTERAEGKKYYAELIGFGTEAAAANFVKKLADKGISVEMKKRTSKTARGKKAVWYQVITALYEDKQKMESLVGVIAKEEKLKDVRFRTC